MVAVTPSDDVAETEALAAEPAEHVPAAEPAERVPAERAIEAAPAAPHQMRHGGTHGMMNGRPPQITRASNTDDTFAEGDHVV